LRTDLELLETIVRDVEYVGDPFSPIASKENKDSRIKIRAQKFPDMDGK